MPTLKSDCQQSTKAMNLKPTSLTALQLSGEISYFFVSHTKSHAVICLPFELLIVLDIDLFVRMSNQANQ